MDATASRRPVDADVATQESNVRASALRLQTLKDLALPASRRAFEITWAGYESSRTDVTALLASRRSVVDVETDIIAARATLDHALADLDAAVGMLVPRIPLSSVPAREHGDRHDH
jgi:outer membrane protein TolC